MPGRFNGSSNKVFQKRVSCRYTLDYWKTWLEANAKFSCKVQPGDTKIDRDRFTFTVKLIASADISTTMLYFYIHYNVDGHEYWDNNSGANFQVNFRKTYQQQIGKYFHGVSKTSDLSTYRPLAPGPKSTSPIFDNLGRIAMLTYV
jgi:carbohydrate/starch-binding protein with CBM21 domain